jgi:hypothetical protein
MDEKNENVIHMPTVDEEIAKAKADVLTSLDKVRRFATEKGALGHVTVIFNDDGTCTEFSDVRVLQPYHVIGALELSKALRCK